jgi:serine/threonine-protein kinase
MPTINPEKWHEVKEIFYAALRHAPEEREQFLNESCKDDDHLRREVESLLSSSDAAGSFMQNPAVGEVADAITGNNEKLRVSQNISHYKIIRLLGEGGMGEVYLAEDTRLERKVALKILPAAFAQDAERMRRFVQEAKAVSALNHPNILTIYETGETDNTNYIASEYVEGETLSERLRGEPLNLKSALDVAAQIASALQAAHGAKIVHRDIKPDNVMIRPDGFVKLLDFGIAKLTEKQPESIDAESATAIQASTTPGMIIGTANYMSPEQARGKAVDARTDIFSFGLVLYEMLSGKRAFEGENAMDVISFILHKEPVPLSRLMPDVPREIERIVGKALRKDCEERYQTAKDLLIDLKDARQDLEFQNKLERTASPNREQAETQIINAVTRDTPPTASSAEYIAAEIKNHKPGFVAVSVLLLAAVGFGYWFFFNHSKQIESIAVMPFVNESGDANVEYLSDGMTETLISSLSQIPKLNVKARSSVFRYKDKETDAATIGKELNVQAILNGRVVVRGNDLTLYVELVNAATENVLWKADYNRSMTNLVSLQSEIARDISQKLRTRLSNSDEQRVTKTYTANPEAYQLYLQGLYHWNKRTAEDIRKSIAFFQQAIDKDSSYAKAYAGLALAYLIVPDYNRHLTKQELKEFELKKRAALRQAQELDDSLAEVHAVLATMNEDAFNPAAAENEYKRAIGLNPNFASAHHFYSRLLGALGRHEEARAEIDKAHELDPFSRSINFNIGARFADARRFDEAIAQYRRVLEMEPSHPVTHVGLAQAYEAKGMYAEAIEEYRTADVLLEKESAETAERKAAALTQALKTGGAQGYWRKRLEFSQKEYDEGYGSAYNIAITYARLNDRDHAFEQLEKSFAAREPDLMWVKTESAFDELGSDSRFQDLLRRIGL